MQHKKDLSIVIPAYKEAENLKMLLPRIFDVLKEMDITFEVIVVDTMEPMDETFAIVTQNGARYVSRHSGNLYGDAVRTGIMQASSRYILFMDADGSHDPIDIERLYNKAQRNCADIVIGSRYIRGGHTDNPFFLIWMSSILNMAYRIVFGIKIKDVSNSFRIYRASILKSIKLVCSNFDIVEEILIRSKNHNKNSVICEIPINFGKRQYGKSKRDLLRFIISYIATMQRLLKIEKHDHQIIEAKESKSKK